MNFHIKFFKLFIACILGLNLLYCTNSPKFSFTKTIKQLNNENYLKVALDMRDTLILVKYTKMVNSIIKYRVNTCEPEVGSFIKLFKKYKNEIHAGIGLYTESQYTYIVYNPKTGVCYYPAKDTNSYFIISNKELKAIKRDTGFYPSPCEDTMVW